VHHVDGWGVVGLVNEDGQLVVWQRNILHRWGGAVLPAIPAVGI